MLSPSSPRTVTPHARRPRTPDSPAGIAFVHDVFGNQDGSSCFVNAALAFIQHLPWPAMPLPLGDKPEDALTLAVHRCVQAMRARSPMDELASLRDTVRRRLADIHPDLATGQHDAGEAISSILHAVGAGILGNTCERVLSTSCQDPHASCPLTRPRVVTTDSAVVACLGTHDIDRDTFVNPLLTDSSKFLSCVPHCKGPWTCTEHVTTRDFVVLDLSGSSGAERYISTGEIRLGQRTDDGYMVLSSVVHVPLSGDSGHFLCLRRTPSGWEAIDDNSVGSYRSPRPGYVPSCFALLVRSSVCARSQTLRYMVRSTWSRGESTDVIRRPRVRQGPASSPSASSEGSPRSPPRAHKPIWSRGRGGAGNLSSAGGRRDKPRPT